MGFPPYLYTQYAGDAGLVALNASKTALMQKFYDATSDLWPVDYLNPDLCGAWLDIAAISIYGLSRYSFVFSRVLALDGGLAKYFITQQPIDWVSSQGADEGGVAVSDDLFRRIITWNCFMGDGGDFTVEWLKRRVKRFLTGTRGETMNFNGTADVSLSYDGKGGCALKILNAENYVPADLYILQTLLRSGVLHLPEGFTLTF